MRALTLDDIAKQFGRSREWASDHWRDLVAKGKLPPPLLDTGPPTWSPAQVYAVQDKKLPAATRAVAAAFRAAEEAASRSPAERLEADDDDAWRDRLDRRFNKERV